MSLCNFGAEYENLGRTLQSTSEFLQNMVLSSLLQTEEGACSAVGNKVALQQRQILDQDAAAKLLNEMENALYTTLTRSYEVNRMGPVFDNSDCQYGSSMVRVDFEDLSTYSSVERADENATVYSDCR